MFFTSDTHFYHKNIIKFCNRPFSSVEEMNERLIGGWNSVVSPHDEVYHLGDLAFCGTEEMWEIVIRLNGKKYLILGNHDKIPEKVAKEFKWIKQYYELRDAIPHIVLFHYPIQEWNGFYKGNWHLYGHVHGTLPMSPYKALDVGVDCHPEYRPFHYDEIKEYMKTRRNE